MDRSLPVAFPTAGPLQPLVHVSPLLRVLQIKINILSTLRCLFLQASDLVVNLRIPVIVVRVCVEGVEEMPDNV